MVLLTMTLAIVRAICACRNLSLDDNTKLQDLAEPSLAEPEVGNPISHSQVIEVSKLLRGHVDEYQNDEDGENLPYYHLDRLLRGSKLHVAPPPPKKEPTPEYKAMMERLRRDEELRAYERMLHSPNALGTSFQRFLASPHAELYSQATQFTEEQDDVTYAEVHRQIILIINVLVSIVACAVFIWIAARHWSVPKRLGLSMTGSGFIGMAEVVIYSGYVRRLRDAKVKEKEKAEVKEILQTWVIEGASKRVSMATKSSPSEKTESEMRHRKGKHH